MNITPANYASMWGMADAAQRYNGAAQNIATGAGDVATNLVEATITAPAAHALNAAVFRTADETQKSLIDVLA